MPSPKEVLELIAQYKDNQESYEAPHFNETQTRVQFLNPLFKALGWDVDNRAGYAEAYKDVVNEDAVKVGGATKAPDYCFRVGGARKFFLEAKKPSVNIKDDADPAYQLRRYAWSAKLPLSVLSNFAELAVYDCRARPNQHDKAAKSRIHYWTCDQFAHNWDEIAAIFSKEAVLKGSFDKFAVGSRNKRGTAEVDSEFLIEIEEWRDLLAKNFALRNSDLSQRDLNFAVQQTIDRIIFLRICEDRGIEKYGRLQALLNGEHTYARLKQLFVEADERYNSGLFHFREEKGRKQAPDELTPKLGVDDKALKDIFKRLYYPECPYEFSVLSADILGQVYEQFLGKVIRLTAAGHAKIEDKPEVKKAGGVYYTPTYIVDYIVRQTVGRLLEGKTHKTLKRLTVLDPACGSGSFLLGAYQYLLDWYLKKYIEEGPGAYAKGKRPKLFKSEKLGWRLTTGERKRILLAHIYGVDIDTQAVEVTKLSLLLKVLEEESAENINKTWEFFHERALPDLESNIKCGNSLIGPDYFQGRFDFNDEERVLINPFDWKIEFSEIIKTGGFNAVIGNPPYGFHEIHAEETKPYLKSRFSSSKGSFEHYFLFYEQSLRLLAKSGFHGFIVPVTWLTIPSASALRTFILDNYWINEICWLPELVFKNAQVNTLISIIGSTPTSNIDIKIFDTLGFKYPEKIRRAIPQSQFVKSNHVINIFEDATETRLLEKIRLASRPLKELARPCSGYNPYEVGKGIDPNGKPQTKLTVETKPYHSDHKLGPDWKPEIVGRDLGRYSLRITGKRWIKYGPWLAAARDPSNFSGKRVLVQEITGGQNHRIVAAFCDKDLFHSRDVVPIKFDSDDIHPYFVLAIINSALISWYHWKRNPKAQKGLFPKVLVSDLEQLPIVKASQQNKTGLNKYKYMIELVSTIIKLISKIGTANTSHEQNLVQRQIEATDSQIDELVYELYGLTEEEIKIVEAGAAS